MASLNKVHLIGRLGQDPELRYTKTNMAVCNLSIATSEKTKAGERVEWHRVVCWDKLAENCAKFLAKGREAFIEGRITSKEYTDKNGAKAFSTEIIATNVLFLGDKGRSDDAIPNDPFHAPPPAQPDMSSLDAIPF